METRKSGEAMPPLSISKSLPHPVSHHNSQHRLQLEVNSYPFAGRLGGNQEFTLTRSDPEHREVLKHTPDAAPFCTWKESFAVKQFLQIQLWKAALVEAWAAMMLVYLTVIIAVGLGPVVGELSTGPLVPSIVGGISNAIILPLFIFSAGPVSGGHINPTITISTFFTRLATFPRALLYVSFQMAGAAIGGLLVRASLGTRDWKVAGCYFDTSLVSVRDAFTIEFTTCMVLIFLSFGVGLDPRQKAVFGPALAPIFVGLILGICSFGTGFFRPGYTGFSGNPARCFGVMVGSDFSSYHWVHWVAPIIAGAVNGLMYQIVPPYFHLNPLKDQSAA